MPAYVVFIREKTLDRSELEAYWSRASATMEGHPIKVLAAYWATCDARRPGGRGDRRGRVPVGRRGPRLVRQPGLSRGGRASVPRSRVPRPDRRGRVTRRGKDTAIVSSSMSSLFIGWLAKAGQKASQHLRHLGPTNASVSGKCPPVLEPAVVQQRLRCRGRHLAVNAGREV